MVDQKDIEQILWKHWHSAFPKRENVPNAAKAITKFINDQKQEK